jgi:hypothetical protein
VAAPLDRVRRGGTRHHERVAGLSRPTTSNAGSKPTGARATRLARAFAVVLAPVLVVVAGYLAIGVIHDRAETTRTTARYDPPVLAGQIVPGACSGGFYAHRGDTIVLTFAADCGVPGATVRHPGGDPVGVLGPEATLADCPAGRKCLASDFLALALAPDRIPWGHLNLVDLGAGGYHTIAPGTQPLACGDMHVGDAVELDGREHFRTGKVISTGRYENATDIIFPCMVVADIEAVVGDSGGAVLVNGIPAGSTSRRIDGNLGFTPLAEGLEHFGLTLCTTPDCDVSPGGSPAPSPAGS